MSIPNDPATAAAAIRAADARVRMHRAVTAAVAQDSERARPVTLLLGVKQCCTEHSALMELLLRKGIITWQEYFEQVAEWSDVLTRTLEADMENTP